ncbi:hypothetical protein PHMEG_00036398 [Phytophthora megakarya]|uniref:Uncharacterized protein n=1 Tax=Phytophthora megakarya TaxID=4795 RepID=A0A225ULM7_9STRA|nr:hypothetical protein PHMEG_00036398 [Phytophthora megakarya]
MREKDIWESVGAKFYGSDKEELLEGLTQEQVVGLVRRIRRRDYGGNIHGVVEVPPYSKAALFMDGTFRCVPCGFYECVIVMIDDPARNMFTPIYFMLCTSKKETMYEDVLQHINRDTGKKMTPAEVVVEFSLISSLQQQFPNAEVVGCFFQFKQALLR